MILADPNSVEVGSIVKFNVAYDSNQEQSKNSTSFMELMVKRRENDDGE